MSTTQIELPIAYATAAEQHRLDPGERDRLIRRAKTLSWLSLAYMTAEGAIAITAALLAGSVALLGFGLDSGIEALASVIVIWRFTGSRRLSQDAERHAQRLVAISFFLLAPYIAQDAIRALTTGEHPRPSWLGIGLSISSIIVMPQLGKAKHRIGQRLGSGATAGEGTQNMLCAYLAAGVLIGPPAQRHLQPVVGGSRRRARDRRPGNQGRPPNLARQGLLRRPNHQQRKQHGLRPRLLPLSPRAGPDPEPRRRRFHPPTHPLRECAVPARRSTPGRGRGRHSGARRGPVRPGHCWAGFPFSRRSMARRGSP